MDKRLHIVVFLLFSLSTIVIMGSGDKTELLFHLLIVSILGFFALFVYHKQTVESFVCDKKVLDDELDGFYKSMLAEKDNDKLKGNESKSNFESVEKEDKLGKFYSALVKRDPLVEFTEGKRNGNEEYEKDGDFKRFFNSRDKEAHKTFTGYEKHSNSVALGAPLDNMIGEYDGVVINAEKYQYRRAMMPGVEDCGIPSLDEKCGSLSAPCSGVKINNPFHVDPEGREVPLNLETKPEDNLFMFSHNKASPDCCPSTYTTSNGCVCTTTKQRNMIGGRGNKSPYNH